MPTKLEAQITRKLGLVRSFSALLTDLGDVDDVMAALAAHVAVASRAFSASVVLTRPEYRCLPAANATVAAVEQAMVAAQAGPAIDAISQRRVVKAADVTCEQFTVRWPAFGSAARDAGIGGVAALPMTAPDRVIGALQIYRRQPTHWSDVDIAVARTLSDVASSHLVQLERLGEYRHTAVQLQYALTSRIDIEQAKGIAAVMLNTYTEDAFVALRNVARINNTRLHDVCALLVRPYRREPGPLPVVDEVVAAIIDNVLRCDESVKPQARHRGRAS